MSRIISSILLAMAMLAFSSPLMAGNPIGVRTYLGDWCDDLNPTKPVLTITHTDEQIIIGGLAGKGIVGAVNHNSHSLSYLELLSDVVFWKFDERWRILLNLFNLQQAHMGQGVRRESEYDSRRQDARLPAE